MLALQQSMNPAIPAERKFGLIYLSFMGFELSAERPVLVPPTSEQNNHIPERRAGLTEMGNGKDFLMELNNQAGIGNAAVGR